jgi:hypothetical protein
MKRGRPTGSQALARWASMDASQATLAFSWSLMRSEKRSDAQQAVQDAPETQVSNIATHVNIAVNHGSVSWAL